jgi:hypothetical protein
VHQEKQPDELRHQAIQIPELNHFNGLLEEEKSILVKKKSILSWISLFLFRLKRKDCRTCSTSAEGSTWDATEKCSKAHHQSLVIR